MAYGERVFLSNGAYAEGDKLFTYGIYNDTTGNLTMGMPLYKDCTDAAEWNNRYSTTALSPAVQATGGNMVLGTNAAATNLFCVGVYQPQNPQDKPSKGDAIRIQIWGAALISACAKASGTAVKVGDILITDSSQTSVLSGHNTYTVGAVVGYALATGTLVASGNTIIAVPGSSATTQVINGFVKLA